MFLRAPPLLPEVCSVSRNRKGRRACVLRSFKGLAPKNPIMVTKRKRSSHLVSHSSLPFYHPFASASHPPVSFPDPNFFHLPFQRRGTRKSRADPDWLANRNCIGPLISITLLPGPQLSSNIMEPYDRNPRRVMSHNSLPRNPESRISSLQKVSWFTPQI